MVRIVQKIRQSLSGGLKRDIFWTLLGQVTVLLVLLAVNKLMSNALSVEEFGRYNVIRRSTSVISFVLLGGLGITVPRYLSISISKHRFHEAQGLIAATWIYMFLLTAVVTVSYILLYRSMAVLVIGDLNVPFYAVCLLYAASTALASYIFAYYRGIGQFKLFNLSQIIYQLLMLVPLALRIESLLAIITWWSLLNMLFVVLVLVRELCHYRSVVSHFKQTLSGIKGSLRQIAGYSLPRLFGDFFLFAYSAFPVIYIGNRLSLEDASFYSVGVSLVTMITPVFSFLGVVLLPEVSKMMAAKRLADAGRLVSRLAVVYLILAGALTVMLYLLMDQFICIFFAEKYLQASAAGKIIALSLVPQSLYLLYRNPNDAVAVFPFNTLILAICFALLVVGFVLTESIMQYAYIYLLLSVLQCVMSVAVWFYLIKKNGHEV